MLPIALGGTLLALLLVGAAGSYWADRRYAEVRLLSARGVGPGPLAGKAVLELAGPAVVGTVLGWLLAGRLVTALGPSPDLDAGAPAQAALTAGVALVAGLALLGLVAGLRARNATERPAGARRSLLALVPCERCRSAPRSPATWRCGPAGRSCWWRTWPRSTCWWSRPTAVHPRRLGAGVRLLAAPAAPAGRPDRPAAGGLVSGRPAGDRGPGGQRRAAGRGRHPGGDGGLRRRAHHRLGQTLTAKARLFTGAGVSVNTTDTLSRTAAVERAGTVVRRYSYGTVGGAEVALLAVDPDSLLRTAYWRPEFARRSLPDLLATLTGPAPDGRVPAIVVDPRGELGPTADVTLARAPRGWRRWRRRCCSRAGGCRTR